MKTLILFIYLITALQSGHAQNAQEFTDLKGDYLGQTPPGDIPVVFAPGTVSTDKLEHSPAVFSYDGNEVYWCSNEFPLNKNKMYIWSMKRISNRWTKPEILAPLGNNVNYCDVFLSIDGKKLYFGADIDVITESGANRLENTANYDIWFIEKQGNGWSKPQGISPVINTADNQSHATLNSAGTVYFLGNLKGGKQECGIFRSRFQNGKYLPPEALPECINSTVVLDWTPYIAPDDSYLIFSSHREGEFGDGDLYISFHDCSSDTWSEPVNMGEPINTRVQERFPAVGPDGKYLFFTRYNPPHSQDIFWVSAGIIEKLKAKVVQEQRLKTNTSQEDPK